MQWSETVKGYIQALPPVEVNAALLTKVMGLIDLTSLNQADTEASIANCCQKAITPLGHAAAVCVYPQFASQVVSILANTPVKTATVANFPDGSTPLEAVLIEIGKALDEGVQEIDAVFPYRRYFAGERHYASTFVTACKAACGHDVTLKVILETGALNDPAIIADACYDALLAGADFIKTSTGKTTTGATLEAAATLLLVIHHLQPQIKRRLGIKVAGGIKTVQQAAHYIHLADNIMGQDWITPDTFRLGSSQLVDELVSHL